ncbi:RraA family protein [uncultured Pseudokineococcus sp.]|uniref:RraA family protein n=1 Tax=uncultured Pseudokineococcus sp. TaxID=1642928 RepID=UPI00260F2501|nr:RraA family protein [uncultured Pseudokineococcus sp.]
MTTSEANPAAAAGGTDEVLALFEGLRVADVRDGLDWVGLPHRGSVTREISSVAPGMSLCGRAFTVRSRPSDKVVPHGISPEEYTDWAREYWYGEVNTSKAWRDQLRPGDVVVIEGADLGVGEVGSNNSLGWHTLGAVGVVTSGGVRDVDECVRQGVPIFARYRSQSMTQGRIEFADAGEPVALGDVLVRRGDVVVADGDGVIVVPVERAEEVARYGRQELENDKAIRRGYYETLGWPLDETVR